jgi:peroxiredoxin
MNRFTRRAVMTLPALVALFATSPAAPASGDLGPAVGGKAPEIGALQDAEGKSHSLASLMGQNGVVLAFYRSADWCPYCQVQLIELNSRHADFERRGYRLAGISYDTPAALKRFVDNRSIAFPLLSDPGSTVIDRYGLRDPAYPPGHRAHGVPRPIIIVLDRDGVVKAKLYEESYRTRPPTAVVLEALDKLR